MPVVINDKNAKKNLKSASIAGSSARALRQGYVRVQAPRVNDVAGEILTLTTEQAADMVNHHGWSKLPEPVVVVSSDEGKVDPVEGIKKTKAPEKEVEKAKDLGELSALRAELEALGKEVDSRWGLKSLREKIADAKEEAAEAKAKAEAEAKDAE